MLTSKEKEIVEAYVRNRIEEKIGELKLSNGQDFSINPNVCSKTKDDVKYTVVSEDSKLIQASPRPDKDGNIYTQYYELKYEVFVAVKSEQINYALSSLSIDKNN